MTKFWVIVVAALLATTPHLQASTTSNPEPTTAADSCPVDPADILDINVDELLVES